MYRLSTADGQSKQQVACDSTSTEVTLESVVARVAADSRHTPDEYLKETVVPGGGE